MSAQTAEAFGNALIAFTIAQQGTFGDEGPQVTAALDALERTLAAWDVEFARTRTRAAEELRSANPQQAVRIRVALAREEIKRGQFSEAAAALDQAIAGGADYDALLLRGYVHEAQSQPAEAASAFTRAWESRPDGLPAAYKAWSYRAHLGEDDVARLRNSFVALSQRAGDLRRATFPDMRGVSDAGPPLLPLHAYAEGYRLVARHRYSEAVASFRAAAALDPLVSGLAGKDVVAGIAALKEGRRVDAVKVLERAVAASAQSAAARRALAIAHWLGDDFSASATHLEAAVRIDAMNERARVALARVLVQSDRLHEAESLLRETITLLPDSGAAHWWLSNVYSSLNRGIEALDVLSEPAAHLGVLGKGQLYSRLSQLHELGTNLAGGIAPLRRWVGLSPNDPIAHLSLARTYIYLDHLDDALAEYVIASSLDPRQAAAYVGIGQVHLASGRNGDAVTALERAVALQPSNPEARNALALALAAAGRDTDAAVHRAEFARLQSAASGERRRTMTLDVMREEARLRGSSGEHARAVELWRDVIEQEPNVAANHAGLGSALAQAGRSGDAIKAYEAAAALGGDAKVHRELAMLYAEVNRPDDARRSRERFEHALQSLLLPSSSR